MPYTDVKLILKNNSGDFREEILSLTGENTLVVFDGVTKNPSLVEVSTLGGTWGSITGTLSDQTDLQGELDDKFNLDQTTPQHIENGIPIFDDGIQIGDESNFATLVAINHDNISGKLWFYPNNLELSASPIHSFFQEIDGTVHFQMGHVDDATLAAVTDFMYDAAAPALSLLKITTPIGTSFSTPLYDTSEFLSVDLNTRELYDSAGTLMASWADLHFSFETGAARFISQIIGNDIQIGLDNDGNDEWFAFGGFGGSSIPYIKLGIIIDGVNSQNIIGASSIDSNIRILYATDGISPSIDWSDDAAIKFPGILTDAGDIIYGGADGIATRLGIGSANTVLHGGASAPVYSAVVEDDISLSNNTTNNATTSKHGFLSILPDDPLQYLNGQGNFAIPSGIANSYKTQSFITQTSVNVVHNFGTYPIVQVLDDTDSVIIPQSIVNNTVNDFTVTFSIATTGNIIASVGSPQPMQFISVNDDYDILISDRIIKVAAANKLMTLPTAVGNTGREFIINNTSSGDVSVNVTGSELINDELLQVVPTHSSMTVYSDGSGYWII
jgi:hypothetical protein